MRYLVGVDEMAVHPTGHVSGGYLIESMGIDERIALHQLRTIGKGGVAQFLVVIVLEGLLGKVAANDGIHENGNPTPFTRLPNKLCQIIIEGRPRIGMAFNSRLFVVMAELDDDIIARFHRREHLVPSAFVDKTLRRTSVDRMIIHPDISRVEIALQRHSPASFRRAS